MPSIKDIMAKYTADDSDTVDRVRAVEPEKARMEPSGAIDRLMRKHVPTTPSPTPASSDTWKYQLASGVTPQPSHPVQVPAQKALGADLDPSQQAELARTIERNRIASLSTEDKLQDPQFRKLIAARDVDLKARGDAEAAVAKIPQAVEEALIGGMSPESAFARLRVPEAYRAGAEQAFKQYYGSQARFKEALRKTGDFISDYTGALTTTSLLDPNSKADVFNRFTKYLTTLPPDDRKAAASAFGRMVAPEDKGFFEDIVLNTLRGAKSTGDILKFAGKTALEATGLSKDEFGQAAAEYTEGRRVQAEMDKHDPSGYAGQTMRIITEMLPGGVGMFGRRSVETTADFIDKGVSPGASLFLGLSTGFVEGILERAQIRGLSRGVLSKGINKAISQMQSGLGRFVANNVATAVKESSIEALQGMSAEYFNVVADLVSEEVDDPSAKEAIMRVLQAGVDDFQSSIVPMLIISAPGAAGRSARSVRTDTSRGGPVLGPEQALFAEQVPGAVEEAAPAELAPDATPVPTHLITPQTIPGQAPTETQIDRVRESIESRAEPTTSEVEKDLADRAKKKAKVKRIHEGKKLAVAETLEAEGKREAQRGLETIKEEAKRAFDDVIHQKEITDRIDAAVKSLPILEEKARELSQIGGDENVPAKYRKAALEAEGKVQDQIRDIKSIRRFEKEPSPPPAPAKSLDVVAKEAGFEGAEPLPGERIAPEKAARAVELERKAAVLEKHKAPERAAELRKRATKEAGVAVTPEGIPTDERVERVARGLADARKQKVSIPGARKALKNARAALKAGKDPRAELVKAESLLEKAKMLPAPGIEAAFREVRKKVAPAVAKGTPMGGGVPGTIEAPSTKVQKTPTNPDVVRVSKQLTAAGIKGDARKTMVSEASKGRTNKVSELTKEERDTLETRARITEAELKKELKEKAPEDLRQKAGREPTDEEVKRQKETAEAAVADVSKKHGTKYQRPAGQSRDVGKTLMERVKQNPVYRLMVTSNANPETSAEYVFGRNSKVTEEITEGARDTIDSYHRISNAVLDPFRRSLADAGLSGESIGEVSSMSRKKGEAPKHSIKVSNGTVTGTIAELLDPVWLSQDPHWKKAIAEDGYVFGDGKPIKLTPADIAIIEKDLRSRNPKLFDAIDEWNRINRDILGPQTANVVWRADATSLDLSRDYVPGRRQLEAVKAKQIQEDSPEAQEAKFLDELVRLFSGGKARKNVRTALSPATKTLPTGGPEIGDPSFVKERVGGGVPVQGQDAIVRQLHHMMNSANYISKYEYTKRMNELLHNTKVREAVRDGVADGDYHLDNIWDAVKNHYQPDFVRHSDVDGIYNRMLKRIGRAALGLKPQVVLYQVPSAVYAAGDLGTKNVLSAMTAGRSELAQARSEIEKYAPSIAARISGTGSRIATLGKTESARDTIRENLGLSAPILDRAAYGPIHAADTQVMLRIWIAAKAKATAENPRASHEDIMRAANVLARRAIGRTQPDWSILAQSTFQRDARRSPFKRTMAMFSSQTGQVANMAMRAVDAYRDGEISFGQMLKEVIPPMIVGPIVIEGIQRGIFGLYGLAAGQGEEERKKYDRSWSEAIASTLSRGFSGFIIPSKVAGITAGILNRAFGEKKMHPSVTKADPVVQMVSDIDRAVSEIVDTIQRMRGQVRHKRTGERLEPKTDVAISALLRALGPLLGLPILGAEQILRPQLQSRLGPKTDRRRLLK